MNFTYQRALICHLIAIQLQLISICDNWFMILIIQIIFGQTFEQLNH